MWQTSQEAQQDTVTSFEHFMEDCMARDWATNKRQLFGIIAPHSGTASGAAARLHGVGAAGGGGAQLPLKEAAYVAVIQQANQAAAGGNQVHEGLIGLELVGYGQGRHSG